MRGILLSSALAAAALWAQPRPAVVREGEYWVQVVEGSTPAAGAASLHVAAWGDIRLTGGDAATVSYSLRKRVRAAGPGEAQRLLARWTAAATRRGGTVRLEVAGPEWPGTAPSLSVTAPRGMALCRLETAGGEIEARDLAGKLIAESGGGRIVADAVLGGVVAETGGGEILLGRVGGEIRGISGAGSIRVEDAAGPSWFETAGGEIHVGTAGGPVRASTGGGNIYVRRAASTVTASTDGGLVQVLEAGGPVKAETAAGAIEVSAAGGVECESARGTIRLRDVWGPVRATTASGNIVAELLPGRALRNSVLGTSRGDITVLIPSNLAVTVKAEVVPAGRAGRIISDFPEIQLLEEGEVLWNPWIAEGRINGGGPLLTISATGGTISLRRR